MFDFLSEEKRRKIINHPELGKPYFSGIIKKERFIDNLDAFASSLCSPSVSQEIRFTSEEIERIKRVVEGISSPEFQNLIEKLYYEAGFEVFIHAMGREDLNDWIHDPESYIRAVHRLHGMTRHQEFLNQFSGRGAYETGIPLDKILPSIVSDPYQIKIQSPHGSHAEKFADNYWGLRYGVIPSLHPPIEENFYARRETVYPHYITCWMFGEFEIDETRESLPSPEKIKVKKKGLLGKLGFKEEKPKFRILRKLKNTSYIPLNRIVITKDDSPAYLLQLVVQKAVADSAKRPGACPRVSIIANKDLVEKTISFLLRYPDLYYDFIRGFMPKSMFPNVNKGILSPPFLNTKGLVFQNYTNGIEISVD